MDPEKITQREYKESLTSDEIKATLEFVRSNPILFPLPEVVVKEKSRTETAQRVDVKGRQIDTVKYVTFLHLHGREFALKTYGTGKRITKHEAEILSTCYTKNYLQFKKYGILTPENYLVTTNYNEPETTIIIIDDFIGDGKNMSDLFINPVVKDSQKIEGYRTMLKICTSIPRTTREFSQFDTDVIGDFKPANFVMEDDGRLFFVDMFAPKLRDQNDGFVSPYLPKLEDLSRSVITFLCGDIRGIVARLLGLSRKAMPHLNTSLEEVTRAALKNEDPKILEFIEEQVENDFRNISNLYHYKDEEFYKFEETIDQI